MTIVNVVFLLVFIVIYTMAIKINDIEEKITPPTYKILDEEEQNDIRIKRDSIVEEQIQKST